VLRTTPTPPWGVPCSGNSGLTPALRQRKIPFFMPCGAMRLSMIAVWLILSKHFSISSSMTRFSFADSFDCILNTESEITRCPTRIKRVPYLVLPTWGSTFPWTLNSFLFVPQMRLLCTVRWNHFNR